MYKRLLHPEGGSAGLVWCRAGRSLESVGAGLEAGRESRPGWVSVRGLGPWEQPGSGVGQNLELVLADLMLGPGQTGVQEIRSPGGLWSWQVPRVAWGPGFRGAPGAECYRSCRGPWSQWLLGWARGLDPHRHLLGAACRHESWLWSAGWSGPQFSLSFHEDHSLCTGLLRPGKRL